MEVNKQNLTALANYLKQTLSPDKSTRDAAEQYLNSISHHAGFPVLLLKLVEVDSGPCRLSAAVLFKNTIAKRWVPDEFSEKENSPIVEADRGAIKTGLVNLMVIVPQLIQRQLSAAISIISKTDFPDRWNSLLPELVSKFNTNDFGVINAVLETANAICKRFRNVANNDKHRYPLKVALDQFQEPLLRMFNMLNKMSVQHKDNKEALECIFQALRTVTRIFYSLNWLDLPEYFEEHMNEWFGAFHHFLEYSNPLLQDRDEDYEADILLKLKKSILKNVNLYAGKYEEEFQPFFQTFAQSVWKQLTGSSAQPKNDKLVTASMQFLSAVVVKQAHSNVFSGQDSLQSIIKTIVIPNVALREVDEELLEDNPVGYIRRDIEGSDTDTRRRAACDLVRALCRLFETEVTPICTAAIQELLQQHAANPTNWKAKDSAMNLMTALSIRAQTRQRGVSRLNAGVNILSFFEQHVLPELSSTNNHPVIQADALKFVTTFRAQMTKQQYVSLFPFLLRYLASPHYVVHTYAANCIERLLMQKDRVEGSPLRLRFGKTALKPFLEPLLTALFGILSRQAAARKPMENDYVMHCIMRVISVGDTDVAPFISTFLQMMTQILSVVCANPAHPKFNHYMFEAVAVLVRNACKANAASSVTLRDALFPSFENVLKADIVEFTPYVYQIMAQLLHYNPNGITDGPWEALLPKIIHPMLWEKRGNVPALVNLLEAYMKRGSNYVAGHPKVVEGILGVFQKLLASKATELYAVALITSLTSHLPQSAWNKFLPTIMQLLMYRLAAPKKSVKYPYLLLPFFGRFFGMHGASATIGILEGLKSGMFAMLVNQVWCPNVTKITDNCARRCCAVGMTSLLCSTPELRVGGAQHALWLPLLEALVGLLEGESGDADIGKEVVGAEEIEYMSSAGFSKLSFASEAKETPFKDIAPDLKSFVAQKLAELSRNQSISGLLGALKSDTQGILQLYIRNAGVVIS
eukprot:g740.t1